jgi:AcrR family transcriptional regulator
MSEVVKRKSEPGGRRAAQTRVTRRRITDAALGLFQRHGYAATTLDQIAAAAGVAVQTVYFHFGNKATVLKEVVDVLAVGDDEPIPMLDRPWVRQVREEPDARRALAIWLGNARVIFTRITPIMKIVRDAAGADPAMAAQWDANQQQRFTAHQAMVQQLAEKQALKPHVSAAEATDIVFTLVSPEVYYLLTVERGWTPEQWERWIIDTIATTILR